MAIIAVILIVLVGYWLVPPGIRAIEAAISTQKLSKDLRKGRVEIAKLFEQGLPRTAEERFKVLCEKAEMHCRRRDIEPHEYLTLFPALPEFINAYFTTEAEWSSRTLSYGSNDKTSVNIKPKSNEDKLPGITPNPKVKTYSAEGFADLPKTWDEFHKKFAPGSDSRAAFEDSFYKLTEKRMKLKTSDTELEDSKTWSKNEVTNEENFSESNIDSFRKDTSVHNYGEKKPALNSSASSATSQKDSAKPFVSIIPNQTTGALINVYQEAPKYGYVQLQSETTFLVGEWLRKKKRTALLRGEVVQLEEFIKGAAKDGMLPGMIVVREFLESELPDQFASRIDKTRNYEDAVAQYIKRAPKGGPSLTFRGERIFRFSDWVPAPKETDVDVFITHDNQEEVEKWEQTLRV